MFLHIDIDCFFASAERTLDPTLKGIPMAVGSRSNLEIFNKKRTNIRLMNDNSGAFVTPVFYSDKKKTFENRNPQINPTKHPLSQFYFHLSST